MARIGIIVPSSNTTAEPEFAQMMPSDSTVHVARMPLKQVTVDELDAMAEGAERAARLLSHASVDGIAYACTTGSLLHGTGFDAELEEKLSSISMTPAVATALSVKRAFNAVGVSRIGVVTPYTSELDELEREYLTESGFTVVTMDGKGLTNNLDIGELTPDDAYEQAISAIPKSTDIEGVFISCTNYRTIDSLARLEEYFDLPVISSNLATIWDLGQRITLDIESSLRLFKATA